MTGVDSSAFIPLARVGRLDLVDTILGDVWTVDDVRDEVTEIGKRGSTALRSYLEEEVAIYETPESAGNVARQEGIAVADAAIVLLAAQRDDRLLANDKALIEVARTRNVDCWWVTTLLMEGVNRDALSAGEAGDVLYDLVDEGMNLHPQIYTKVQRQFEELESDAESTGDDT